jgi:SRSO17 transposase
MTTYEDLEDWRSPLDALHARIAGRFRRVEARERAKRYLLGLLDRVERKNGWQLAEQLGERGPQGVQRLLNAAIWDEEAVRDDLRAYVVEHLGAPDGVLIVDETGFLKKGTKSVGVQRQYSGTAGRRENCQIGVFLGYASPTGRALVDRELYLPEVWAADSARRTEAGIPEAVTFATKPQLARRMLERALGAGVPAAWVTADERSGNDTDLRRWLEHIEQPYVLAVSSNHPVWRAGSQEPADKLVAALPADCWGMLSCGAGSQGERWYDWACLQLPYDTVPGMAQWLLVRRSRSDPKEVAYFRAYGPDATALETLVRVAGTRWAIEESFEDAKELVGLDQYEVRTWRAWYRHITLALLAYAFLEVTRRQVANGQKGGALSCSP